MEITPDKWQRAKALFDAVLQQAPADRAAFLARTCPEDDLRAHVEQLLRNHEQAGSFLSKPVLQQHNRDSAEKSERFASGTIIASRFKIVRLLGKGAVEFEATRVGGAVGHAAAGAFAGVDAPIGASLEGRGAERGLELDHDDAGDVESCEGPVNNALGGLSISWVQPVHEHRTSTTIYLHQTARVERKPQYLGVAKKKSPRRQNFF